LKFSWQARDTKCQFCPDPRANLSVYGALMGAFLTRELPSELSAGLGLPANLCVYGALKRATKLSIITLIVRKTDILVAVFINVAGVHNEFNQ
jgi:hypothetical protein